MAATYIPIASTTLTTSAGSVTFSSIPATYTDLVLRWSGRSTRANIGTDVLITLNSSTATNYSYTFMRGNSASAVSSRGSNQANLWVVTNGTNTTSNTFSSNELYIPNYAASQNKPISSYDVVENNSSSSGQALIDAYAELWRVTDAITSITLAPDASSFVSGSSFFLYGIKSV